MSKNIKILLLVVLIITITGGTGLFLLSRFKSDSADMDAYLPMPPEVVLELYFSYINEEKYDDMYSLISEMSQETFPEEDFILRHRNIYGGIEARNVSITIGDMIDYESGVANSNGGYDSHIIGKMIDYSLSMDTIAGTISFANQALLSHDEDFEYSVEWSHELIFPNFTEEDKVRVNTLTGKRGNIYDRQGNMLAGEGVASAIGFVPGKMNEETDEDIITVGQLLEMEPESIIKKLEASYVREDTFVLLRTISKEDYDRKEELLKVPGIMITDTPVRHYPYGEIASHLVGYIQGINAEELESLGSQGYHANSVLGKDGIEKIYEEELRPADGHEIIIIDGAGNGKTILARKEKEDGEDIILTIDMELQSQLYNLFKEDKSCSVAMNPKTGEVLALVSTPTYDANDFVLGMSVSKWNSLNENADKPLYNRFKAALCPGSTFKAVTAAVAVDTGTVLPGEDFGHSGLRWQQDGSWGGYQITTTIEYDGPANVQNALMYSDNIYFAKAALRIGDDLFAKELKKLGFEERIPFEYPLYSSIISTTETFTSEIQLADSGFGQGQILTNPIHLASIYSAFVNEGSMIQPYLVLQNNSNPRFWQEGVFTPETAATIRNGLIQVVEQGTATDAKVAGLTLGGKTGTAEIKSSQTDQNGTELGWFVLFNADEYAENPLLVISMVEDVKGRGGSHYVSPKVKTIFE